jgi:hypothetical protein
MATKKDPTPHKPKTKKAVPPPPLIPAVPPPDNPLLRSTEFDADREYHSKEMAEKRLDAIRQTRNMPTSEEEPPTTSPEQNASPTQSDSKDDD